MNRYKKRLERDVIMGQVFQAILYLATTARGEYVYLSVWKIRRVMTEHFGFFTRHESPRRSSRVAWALRHILDGTGVPYEAMKTRRGHIYRVRRHELLAALVKNKTIIIRGEAKNA